MGMLKYRSKLYSKPRMFRLLQKICKRKNIHIECPKVIQIYLIVIITVSRKLKLFVCLAIFNWASNNSPQLYERHQILRIFALRTTDPEKFVFFYFDTTLRRGGRRREEKEMAGSSVDPSNGRSTTSYTFRSAGFDPRGRRGMLRKST